MLPSLIAVPFFMIALSAAQSAERQVFLRDNGDCAAIVPSATRRFASLKTIEKGTPHSWAPAWWKEARCQALGNEVATPSSRIVAFAFAWFWFLALATAVLAVVGKTPLKPDERNGLLFLPVLVLAAVAIIVGVVNALLGLVTYAISGATAQYINFHFLFFVLLATTIAAPAAYLFYFVLQRFVKSHSPLRSPLDLKARSVAIVVVALDLIGMALTVKSFAALFL